MSALAGGLRDPLSSWRRSRWPRRFTDNWWGLNARIGPQSSDCIEQLDGDAQLL